MKRSTSERRAAASRANGSKSRGPVTARGKYNSSLNPVRHGLLSRSIVLPGEMPELFRQHYDDFMEEHQPRTPTERALVEEMIAAWWKKQRVWAMESARIIFQVKLSYAMNYAIPSDDPATRTALAVGDLADTGRSLDLFLRYETRYERQFHRALARLLDLQSRDPQPDSDSRGPVLPNRDPILPSRDSNGAVPCASQNVEISTTSPEPAENTHPASPLRRTLSAVVHFVTRPASALATLVPLFTRNFPLREPQTMAA